MDGIDMYHFNYDYSHISNNIYYIFYYYGYYYYYYIMQKWRHVS